MSRIAPGRPPGMLIPRGRQFSVPDCGSSTTGPEAGPFLWGEERVLVQASWFRLGFFVVFRQAFCLSPRYGKTHDPCFGHSARQARCRGRCFPFPRRPAGLTVRDQCRWQVPGTACPQAPARGLPDRIRGGRLFSPAGGGVAVSRLRAGPVHCGGRSVLPCSAGLHTVVLLHLPG
jgi:hypothetical protein